MDPGQWLIYLMMPLVRNFRSQMKWQDDKLPFKGIYMESLMTNCNVVYSNVEGEINIEGLQILFCVKFVE